MSESCKLIDVENLKEVLDMLVAKSVHIACFEPSGSLREVRFKDDPQPMHGAPSAASLTPDQILYASAGS